MTTTAEAKMLHRLHNDLRNAVAEIVRPRTMVQYDDDRNFVATYHGASLLTQLREAIKQGTEKGTGSSAFASKPLLCIGAWDLYRQIEREWRTSGNTLVQSFRDVPQWTSDWTDVESLRAIVVKLQAVAKGIRHFLYPPKRLHVAAACPACNVRTVFRPDESGVLVQRAALTVDGIAGCTCLACHHVWAPAQLEFLATVLGCHVIQ